MKKKRTWLIYKIVFPNGKNYIGLTKNYKARISKHKSCVNTNENIPIYNAIRHFGWDNIRFEVIHNNILTLDEANELEKKYIIEYDSYIKNKNGYNCTLGGDGCEGKPRSKKQVKEFIKQSKERWKDPMYRAKMLEAVKNITYDSEIRSKMSESAKIRIARDGHSWVGRNHKEESKDKMRGSRAGKYDNASYYRGTRVYCSKLNVVFFSVKHCADFLGSRITNVCEALKNPRPGKYESLSYYKTEI